MSISITGVGELPQGRSSFTSTMQLHQALANLALEDACMEFGAIDAILTTSPRSDPFLIHATALAEHMGIRPNVAFTLEAGGAAPSAMVEMARGLIANGTARNVLAVAADMPLSGVTRDSYVNTLTETGPVHPELERPYGPSVPSLFALVAQAHMQAFGTRPEHLAAVAVQDRLSACRHPNANNREPMSAEDYFASRLIADPLRLLDCAPVSDGGGAVIISASDAARDRPTARVLGTGFSVGQLHLSAAESLTGFTAGAAMQQALGQAGIAIADLDAAFVYDCFSIAMLVNLEDLGLVPKGQSGPAFAEGRFAADGALPVNTHGGLLSHGHPARAGGMGNLIEAVQQVRGRAADRQVADAEITMAHGMGGCFASHGITILGRS